MADLLAFLTPKEKEPHTVPVEVIEPTKQESTLRGVIFSIPLPETVEFMIDTTNTPTPEKIGLYLKSKGLKRLLGYTEVTNIHNILASPANILTIDTIHGYLPDLSYDAACEILAALSLGSRRQTKLNFL